MGQHAMTALRLRYVHRFRDRHGKLRHYFRRNGVRVQLPGEPGSAEFMAAYQAALAGQPQRPPIGAARVQPGTVAAVVTAYFGSHDFNTLARSTQTTYRGILERFRAEHGDKPVALLKRAHIAKMLDAKAATPAAANNWLRMVRVLMRFAIERGEREDDPAAAVRGVRHRSGGFTPWKDEHIEAFRAAHPLGMRARLALELLVYSAQRRGDVIRMGRQHARGGRLAIVQQKTGAEIDIPLHPDLQAAIDALPSEHLTFLTTKDGKPFSPAGFTNWFRDCCRAAGLPKGLSAHGVRKARSRQMADAGATTHEIGAVTGHKTLKEVERYTADANRKTLADQAAAKTEKRTQIGKPADPKLANRG